MGERSLRLEGLLKAGAFFLAVLLVVLSISSLRLISNIRGYFEDEIEKRLKNLSELASRELQTRGGEAVSDPYHLYAIKVNESLYDALLIDRRGGVLLDPLNRPGGAYRPGIPEPRLQAVWGGATIISPLYKRNNKTVRSAYFPVKDAASNTIAICEVTLDAEYIGDLTQQGSTYFFLKTMAAVFLMIAVLYVVRSSMLAQRKILKAARGSGYEGDGGGTDEVTFMVNTFHSLVASLKEKEKELKELKDKAEERARSVESFNELVLKCIQSGVMTFNKEGAVITANAASEAILGAAPGSLDGRGCADVFQGGGWLCGLVEKTLDEGKTERRGEGEVGDGQGGTKWIGAGTSPLLDEGGGIIGAIAVFTDITEVKDLRERMELKERIAVLGEMSAGIAHELRNPMGVISGYAEFLARRLGGDGEAKSAADSIREEIKGMDEIIREFMNFSQPAELKISEVDVNLLMDESLRPLSGMAEGVRAVIKKSGGLPHVEGDAVLLRQAFINIIKNAIESMPGGGVLGITTGLDAHGNDAGTRGGKYIKIEISDTGEGMDEKDAAKIFTPFFTTKPKGTGLGLALVQKILIYHGGRAAVKSVKGSGTTFTVLLPAMPEGRAA